MTSLTFYGGVNEIGGNKILLEDKDTKIFLDFGKSFSRRATYFEEFLNPRTSNGIEDPDIAKVAKKYGYTVVTKDVDFVNYCKSENIPVGVLKGNRLYLISDSIQLFGEELPNRLFTSD